ncbi:MAG: low-specificity L-threonine aldolase, partial [Deltaproteobacteria bacterium]|nr:low-specificity L-threonine aldolase [Deltaproteobacteria bacterium]
RGDEYIVGQQAHNYRWEGGGASVLGSIQPQPLDFENDGSLDLHKVAQAIKPNDFHFARTKLLCLENTQAGKVLPLDYMQRASVLAGHHRLGIHLDGARAFNAAVKLNVPIQMIAQHVDSISICLSKGLGAPVGSILCSTRERINKARRWRKVLGGGMRQAGIIAAAGIFALKNNVERMPEDHNNALILANGLAQIDELSVDLKWVQTNMVFVSIDKTYSVPLGEYLKQRGILIFGGETIRLVTHLDITEDDMITVIESIKGFFSSRLYRPRS